MSRLKVFHHNLEIFNAELDPNKEYLIGRASEADILLPKESISRRHMKIFFEHDSWNIAALSNRARVYAGSQILNEMRLLENIEFYIDDYAFHFEIGLSLQNESQPSYHLEAEKNEEHTQIGSTHFIPTLFVINQNTKEELSFELEGKSWIVGRSTKCTINVEEPKLSRQHFEIVKTSSGYEISDLGSSNGTRINDEVIEPKSTRPLVSGDIIRVGNTFFELQLIDPVVQRELLKMKPEPATFNSPYLMPPTKAPPMHVPPVEMSHKKLPLQFAMMMLIGFVLYMMLLPEKGQKNSASKVAVTAPVTKENPELESIYDSAKTLFVQGKYDSALIEVKYLHQKISSYKDSKEMESYIYQALKIQDQKDLMKKREQEKQEFLAKVNSLLQKCSSEKNLSELNKCLGPLYELDPENEKARALVSDLEEKEAEKQRQALNKEQYERDLKKGDRLYHRATKLDRDGDWQEALEAYAAYTDSSYPDPNNKKLVAKDRIKKILQEKEAKITQFKDAAEKLKASEKYKEALINLEKAYALAPSDNHIYSQMQATRNELNIKLKSLYRDSVFEENLGNIDAAKQKWRTIQSLDTPDGTYYQRASRKLKRMGQ